MTTALPPPDEFDAELRRLLVRAAKRELDAQAVAVGRAITCPACGRTSYRPDDVRNGYCGTCHDWTRPPTEDSAHD